MATKLKMQKVKGSAIIDFGHFNVAMEDCNIYCNGWDEDALIILVQDKTDPSKKIQMTFERNDKVEKKEN